MYDAGKIIPGLIVFIGLITVPVWYNAGSSESGDRPELALPEKVEACLADTEFMRTDHMNLLNDWRDRVARDGERFMQKDGKTVHWSDLVPCNTQGSAVIGTRDTGLKGSDGVEMSLTNSCMVCHHDKAAFCDSCHDYLGVVPYCWDCHLTPEVIEKWE